MKNKLMILGVLLLAVSCIDLNGSLKVHEPLNVKRKSGFLNLKTKTITLAPGQYSAELKVKNDHNIQLEIAGLNIGKATIPIKSDNDLDVPSNGAFHIEGRSIHQPFNINGVMRTETDQFGHETSIESCSRSVVEKKCDKVCPRESRGCEVVCHEERVIVEGRQEVSSHLEQTKREVHLEFIAENSNQVAADLTATSTELERIIDRRSLCR